MTMTITKVFCLLSGGIDSSTTLAIALEDFPDSDVECISVDYGQRHKKEMLSAKAVIDYFYDYLGAKIAHHIIKLPNTLTGMLVDKADNEKIPDVSYADLPEGISPTYVSFRNGTMLSLMAARAQSWIMESEKPVKGGVYPVPNYEAVLYCGVHADDGARDAYPDCTLEFIGAMSNAIYVGTYFKARLRAPIIFSEKYEVIEKGTKLGVPFELTWSCYKGEELHCGVCPTCRSRKEGFEKAGIVDPTVYAK
jgi:7-cyano-7-deazaguanine synthase